MNAPHPGGFVAALIALAAVPAAQNDIPLANGTDIIYLHSDPTVGNNPGVTPPNPAGDLYWKIWDDYTLLSASGTIEVSGFERWLYDTDWTTIPNYPDRILTPAVASTAFPGTLEPDFLAGGALTGAEVLILGGPSGLPDPCTVGASCVPGSSCPTGTGILGYSINTVIGTTPGTGIAIPADGFGVGSLGMASVVFYEGGMSFSSGPPGACGLGDYVIPSAASTNENAGDKLGTGDSIWAGRAVASVPFTAPRPFTETYSDGLQFIDPTLFLRMEDTFSGITAEDGVGAVLLPISSGGAALGIEVRDNLHSTGPNLVFGAASSAVLPSAIPVSAGGSAAQLLLVPQPLFNSTLNFWNGSLTPIDGDGDSLFGGQFDEGQFQSVLLPVTNTLPVGLTLFMQAFILDTATFDLFQTNVATCELQA